MGFQYKAATSRDSHMDLFYFHIDSRLRLLTCRQVLSQHGACNIGSCVDS